MICVFTQKYTKITGKQSHCIIISSVLAVLQHWHCYRSVDVCICSRGAYQDQEEDQALSGLAAAVTLKSRGTTYKVSLICICMLLYTLITLQPVAQFRLLCFACGFGSGFAFRVTTCLENLEMLWNLTAVREMSENWPSHWNVGKLCQGKLLIADYI